MGTSVQLGIPTNSYPIFILLGLNGLTVSNAIGKHNQPVYLHNQPVYIHTNCQKKMKMRVQNFSKKLGQAQVHFVNIPPHT
jgi:hypothetical protein